MLSKSASPSQPRPSSPSQLRRHGCGLKGILQRSLIPNSQEWDLTWRPQRAQVKMKSLEQALILCNWCLWKGGNSNTNTDVHRRETTRREERNRYPREDDRGQRPEDRVTCPQFKEPQRLLAKGHCLHKARKVLCASMGTRPY